MELISNVPVVAESYFTGRREAMGELVGAVAGRGTCVIHGPSGVGKTRLAVEYARQNRSKYSLVWILRCDQPATLNASLASLAEQLGLGSAGQGPTAGVRNDIRRWLSANSDWLLIFDNAPGSATVLDLLPRGRNGHLIVTTTQGNWEPLQGKSLHLGPMPREEAAEFLQKRSGRASDPDAEVLAKALGDLPIAMEQAAALVAEQRISFRYYLRMFEQLWAELLDTDHRSGAHPSAVAMAWELSYRQLKASEPVAAQLLGLCSYLSTDDVRMGMLHAGAKFASYPLAPVMADAMALAGAADVLVRYGLAEYDERSIRLHMATASLSRTRLPEGEQKVWARVAMRIATDAFKYRANDGESRRDAAAVLPHVLASAGYVEQLGLDPVAVVKAYDEAGQFFYDCGQYQRARDAFRRALAVGEQAYRAGHPKLAALSDNLAKALARCGQVEQAREHFERAIEIDSRTYGYNDVRVASLVNNYGRYHFAKGDYATARQQFEWARTVIENHYGPDHQRVAAVINNIGYTHGTQGDLSAAREHLERALEMAERTYPEGHPDVARICGNLGRVAQQQGDLKLAKALLEKALVIDRAAQGYEHPDTALDHLYLGDLSMAIKDHPAAERHFRQAMDAAEAAYGLYHPAVLSCLEKLGSARSAAGDADGARWALDRAAAIRRSMGRQEAGSAMAG